MKKFPTRYVVFVLLLSVPMVLLSCKKKGGENKTPEGCYSFSGILVVDDTGMELGTWGTDDGDWESDAYWTQTEWDLIDFPDGVSLDSTYVADTTGWNIGPGIHEQPYNLVLPYPNPAGSVTSLVFKGYGLIKFKAVIVDKYFNRLTTFAFKERFRIVNLDLSDTVKWKNGTLYRMYYTFSATDSMNYYKGHGDILICRGASSVNDCRQYVP